MSQNSQNIEDILTEVIEEYKEQTMRFLKKRCGVKEVVFRKVSKYNLSEVVDIMKETIDMEMEQGNQLYFDVTGGESLVLVAFGMLSKEKSPKRAARALFFLGLGTLLYTISFTVCLHTYENAYETLANLPKGSMFITAGSYAVDFFTALMGAGCLIASFVLRKVIRHPAKVAAKLAKKEAKKAKKCKCK